MDEDVRKPMTFLAVVFIGLAIALGLDRVKASQTFLSDFGAGKEIKNVEDHGGNAALVYKVQPGDAWWKVARDHEVTTRALLEANGAVVGTPLVPGQNIRLPGPAGSPSAAGTATSAPAASASTRPSAGRSSAP
jgi:membrane-bound lytic murein transglycosylase D